MKKIYDYKELERLNKMEINNNLPLIEAKKRTLFAYALDMCNTVKICEDEEIKKNEDIIMNIANTDFDEKFYTTFSHVVANRYFYEKTQEYNKTEDDINTALLKVVGSYLMVKTYNAFSQDTPLHIEFTEKLNDDFVLDLALKIGNQTFDIFNILKITMKKEFHFVENNATIGWEYFSEELCKYYEKVIKLANIKLYNMTTDEEKDGSLAEYKSIEYNTYNSFTGKGEKITYDYINQQIEKYENNKELTAFDKKIKELFINAKEFIDISESEEIKAFNTMSQEEMSKAICKLYYKEKSNNTSLLELKADFIEKIGSYDLLYQYKFMDSLDSKDKANFYFEIIEKNKYENVLDLAFRVNDKELDIFRLLEKCVRYDFVFGNQIPDSIKEKLGIADDITELGEINDKVINKMVKKGKAKVIGPINEDVQVDGFFLPVLDNYFDEKKTFMMEVFNINNNESDSVKPANSKIGRNDPCPCGSGKKYKKCHGK